MRFYFTEQLSEHKFKTREGFLLCKYVIIARTGIQIYTQDEMPVIKADGNGMIQVDRPPEEVFKPESIASYAGKPFVINHPTENGEIIDVTPENWRELAVGTVLNPRQGAGILNDVLIADFLVTDASAIDIIMSGRMKEVSCGYDAEYVETGPGRAKQIDILGNHVALVDNGRCGPKCRIYDHAPEITESIKENTMADKKFGWLGEFIGRAHKARDAAELQAITDEAAGLAEKESTSTADVDHVHVHLHPHTGGDNMPPNLPTATPTPAAAAPAAPAASAAPTNDAEMMKSDIASLQQGHQKICGTLDAICQALGINPDGTDAGAQPGEGEQPGGEGGEGGGFGDELTFNAPMSEKGYTEGSQIEGTQPSLEGNKKLPGDNGFEAPPGTSGAERTGDKRRLVTQRRVADSTGRLQAEWQDLISDAEIIMPGVRMPTVDSRNATTAITSMCNFRRRVLDRVSQDLDGGATLDSITGGSDVRRMTCDSVKVSFKALAAVTRDRNNQMTKTFGGEFMPSGSGPAGSVRTIADLNKKNSDLSSSVWGTGGSTR